MLWWLAGVVTILIIVCIVDQTWGRAVDKATRCSPPPEKDDADAYRATIKAELESGQIKELPRC
jgi:hypothetical protein